MMLCHLVLFAALSLPALVFQTLNKLSLSVRQRTFLFLLSLWSLLRLNRASLIISLVEWRNGSVWSS